MQKRSEERGECRVARQFACMCFSFVPMHKERRRVQRTRVDHRGKGRIIEGKRERDGSERPQNICCMLVDARLQRARGRTEIIVPIPATDRVKRKKRRT